MEMIEKSTATDGTGRQVVVKKVFDDDSKNTQAYHGYNYKKEHYTVHNDGTAWKTDDKGKAKKVSD